MNRQDPQAGSPDIREGKLTDKQSRFAAAYADPHAANGNGTLASKIAGYRGRNTQLAVQASVNLRNPRIRQAIAQALDEQGCTLERAAVAVADAMQATKRRSFLDKSGNIIYADAEPDHRTRLHAAAIRFHLEPSAGFDDEEGVGEQVGGADQQANPVAQNAEAGGLDRAGESDTDDLAQLNPADRALFERVAEIDVELAGLDRELDDRGGEHGTDQ